MAGTDPPEAFCDSARAVWSNAVIREAIIERAPISVLVTLLRVDRDALRRAVGQLYRSIRDEPALKARLMDVRNSVCDLTVTDPAFENYLAVPTSLLVKLIFDRRDFPATLRRSAISTTSHGRTSTSVSCANSIPS